MSNGPPKPPRFILSYARRERDSFLDKFFADLRQELAVREGLDKDPGNPEAGFRDTDAIAGGTDWSRELAAALGEAWACVSLYTPNYFKREACGKEVQVFLDRAGVQYDASGVAQDPRGILPVLWTSMQDLQRNGFPPGVVTKINIRSRKHQARYEADGLRHILRRSPRTIYVDILDDIVRDLVDGFKKRPASLPQPPNFSTIRNAFAGMPAPPPSTQPAGGPASLALFLVVGAGSTGLFGATASQEWEERFEDLDPATSIVVTVIDAAAPATTLVQALEDSSTRNASVVVVVDPSAAASQSTAVLATIQACLDSEEWTGGLVLPGDAASLGPRLRLPAANIDRIHLATLASAANLAAEVRTVWLEVAKRVVNESDVKRQPPGGAKVAERPKVKGPGLETSRNG